MANDENMSSFDINSQDLSCLIEVSQTSHTPEDFEEELDEVVNPLDLEKSKEMEREKTQKGTNSYEVMSMSSKKLKNKNKGRIRSKSKQNSFADLWSSPSDSDINDTSMISVYQNLTKNNEISSDSEDEKDNRNLENRSKKKQNFTRYFTTPQKSNMKKSTQLIQTEQNTQKEVVTIGDDIEDFLSDSDLLDDISLSQISETSHAPLSQPLEGLAKINTQDILAVFKQKMNISKLFDWQNECLRLKDVMKNGSSFIYSAPTSAGKSLVSEVIMLKNALVYPKKMVMVIFPFVSLINEKERKYKTIFDHYGLNWISVHSGKFYKYEPGETNVMLCTIEKANGFFNKLVAEEGLQELSNRISWVIIDEFHTIGSHHRGYFIESIITKILYLKNIKEATPIQIIGMSATLPNLDEVCSWMNASLYMTDFRPVRVNEYIKVRDKIYSAKNFVDLKFDKEIKGLEWDSQQIKNDNKDFYKILPLILETVLKNVEKKDAFEEAMERASGETGSVLVFWFSKQQCEVTCKYLSQICEKNGIDINSEQLQKVRGMI